MYLNVNNANIPPHTHTHKVVVFYYDLIYRPTYVNDTRCWKYWTSSYSSFFFFFM